MSTVPGRRGVPVHPWSLDDVLKLLSLSALGGLCVFAGWAGSSSTGRASTGELWLAVGILGLVLEGAGIALWLLIGTQRVRSRQVALLGPLVERADEPAAGVRHLLVSSESMTRYHRSDCELVSGKDVRPAPRDVHLGAGRGACGVCQP